MRGLARLLMGAFFREVEVEAAGNLPLDGPTVVVANHQNGLVDGLLLISALDRYPRFLGKSTLWRILPLRPFLALAGVVPVYRSVDGEATSRNRAAFETSRRLLSSRGMVAVFPEGISHDEATLQPLRTGAARIALGAGVEDGAPGVTVVPVGLTYDAKARFRSRALVRVGEPIPVDRWARAYLADAHAAARDLTEHIADGLRAVSPAYESWRQADDLGRMARVAVRLDAGEVDLATQDDVTRALAAADADDPDRLADLRTAFAAYERDLAQLGLTDEQVVSSHQARQSLLADAGTAVEVAVSLPPAIVGAAIHLVPYQIMKRVGRRPANEGMKATVKLLGCFFLFIAVYVSLGVLVGQRFGVAAGVGALAAAPVCGYVTVRVGDRLNRLNGRRDGIRAVRRRDGAMATVLADRHEVARLVGGLVGRVVRTTH